MADENVDRPIVQWLRASGHDVVEISAASPEITDVNLLETSRRDGRILITFDRDIGGILRRTRSEHPGVVYLRLHGRGSELWEAFERAWPAVEHLVANHFVTVRNHDVRCRPIPLDDRP